MIQSRCMRILVLIFTLGGSTTLSGQNRMGSFLNSESVGKISPEVGFSHHGYFQANVSDSPEKLRMQQYALDASLPVRQRQGEEDFSVLGHFRLLDLQTAAVLPDTGESLPTAFYDPGVGMQYRKRLKERSVAGGRMMVNSPADHPFEEFRDVDFTAMAFLTRPAGEKDSWIFFLHYASQREFLPYVPLPGVAYRHVMSPGNFMMVGIPFCVLRAEPVKDVFWVEASYFLVTQVHAQANWNVGRLASGPVTLFGNFDWRRDGYYRQDRHDDDHRLFYYEKQIGGGVRWDLSDAMFLEVLGGFSFDRFFFEGEDYGDRDENRIDLQAVPYLGFQAGLLF